MRHQGLFMVVGFFELSVILMLWTVAVTALAKRISGYYADGVVSRDLILAEGFVTFGPMIGACLGAVGAWFVRPTPLGYGTGVVFGATLGLVAALAYARVVVRRITHDGRDRTWGQRRVGDDPAGFTTLGRDAGLRHGRSLEPPLSPLRSHRRPPRQFVR